jgi:hypothetical protein
MNNPKTVYSTHVFKYSPVITWVSHRPERQDQGSKGNVFSDLLGVSTSMDVDVDSVEAELNAYTRVQ